MGLLVRSAARRADRLITGTCAAREEICALLGIERTRFDVIHHGHDSSHVVTPTPEMENMPENLIEQAAQMVLAPLKENPPSGLIVDLSRVNFFGSVFISFLLRCHLLIKKQGAELVLAGVSDRVRELLRMTSLDTLWALYATRAARVNGVWTFFNARQYLAGTETINLADRPLPKWIPRIGLSLTSTSTWLPFCWVCTSMFAMSLLSRPRFSTTT